MTDKARLTRGDAQIPAVPGDLDDPNHQKASGVVELPMHIRWSGPPRTYDLADRQHCARVYEQVLREGNEDDIRYFIRSADLIDLWDDMFLPRLVCRAWAEWLALHHGITLDC